MTYCFKGNVDTFAFCKFTDLFNCIFLYGIYGMNISVSLFSYFEPFIEDVDYYNRIAGFCPDRLEDALSDLAGSPYRNHVARCHLCPVAGMKSY